MTEHEELIEWLRTAAQIIDEADLPDDSTTDERCSRSNTTLERKLLAREERATAGLR